jgi:hypothetical protein
MIVKQWSWQHAKTYDRDPSNPYSYTQVESGTEPRTVNATGGLITNADQGVLLSSWFSQGGYCAAGTVCANRLRRGMKITLHRIRN